MQNKMAEEETDIMNEDSKKDLESLNEDLKEGQEKKQEKANDKRVTPDIYNLYLQLISFGAPNFTSKSLLKMKQDSDVILREEGDIFDNICKNIMNIVYLTLHEVQIVMPARSVFSLKELFSVVSDKVVGFGVASDGAETVHLDFPKNVLDILINHKDNQETIRMLRLHMKMICDAYSNKYGRIARFTT